MSVEELADRIEEVLGDLRQPSRNSQEDVDE
jgi:hypothetical protein